MGIFDRFANPIWHEINQLPLGERRLCVAAVVFPDFIRGTLDGLFVDPLAKLITLPEMNVFDIKSGRASLTPAKRERLVDELMLATLSCCSRQGILQISQRFPPENFPDLVATIALWQINGRLVRKTPATLADTGYSSDQDEAKIQLLLKWMDLLDLTDSQFTPLLCQLYFDERWSTTTDSIIAGGLAGFLRNQQASEVNAKTICAGLSTEVSALIASFVSRLK